MDLLKNITWAFNGISYDQPEVFNKAVIQYQQDTYGNDSHWRPEVIVLE